MTNRLWVADVLELIDQKGIGLKRFLSNRSVLTRISCMSLGQRGLDCVENRNACLLARSKSDGLSGFRIDL
ncbi:MAG: hypothetical protein ACO3X1_16590, partial [Burkholderiaceae bacterium]